MRDFLAELTTALEQGRDCVLCSVVETRGSTPQKAGAAMLVYPDGSQSGTLGGGCVEAEVKQRALRVLGLGAGKPDLLTFCLDDNYGWDDGLVCGGRMSILADPVGLAADRRRTVTAYFRRFRELVEGGQGCTEAVVLADQGFLRTESPPLSGLSPQSSVLSPPRGAGQAVGSRYLFDDRGRPAARVLWPPDGDATAPVPDEVMRHLVPVRERPRPAVHRGIAYLPVPPRITLLIIGGGHVGQAVARLAAEVDFDVWVLDDRERYASRERFPQARRVLVGDVGVTLKTLARDEIGAGTYCLIITRGHAHDEEALYHLAPTVAGYVGMIGSKRKIKLIFEDLIAKGISEEALARVHAPLGFAIGSQTVPEIAISIVAELIACRNLGATIPEARVRVKAGTVNREARS